MTMKNRWVLNLLRTAVQYVRTPPLILIVDDNAENVWRSSRLGSTAHNYEIISALRRRRPGLTRVKEEQPDLDPARHHDAQDGRH